MLMVDTLLSIDEASPHKPTYKVLVDDNVLSESGLIENAAQTCSAIVGKSYFDEEDVEGRNTKLVGFISGVKSFNIIKLPQLNETIVTTANLISRFDADGYSICALNCSIENTEIVLAKCVMNLFIKEVK